MPFFIVSAVGVVIILAAIGVQVLQFAYSIWKRKENLDTTGDPWDGRTLEWSVPSPAPEYNFAILPTVTRRDEWWYAKKELKGRPHKSEYSDIELPKNSGLGFFIGVLAFLFGFGIIWHMWWLGGVAIVAIIVLVALRTMNDDSEYTITAEELFRLDGARFAKKGAKA